MHILSLSKTLKSVPAVDRQPCVADGLRVRCYRPPPRRVVVDRRSRRHRKGGAAATTSPAADGPAVWSEPGALRARCPRQQPRFSWQCGRRRRSCCAGRRPKPPASVALCRGAGGPGSSRSWWPASGGRFAGCARQRRSFSAHGMKPALIIDHGRKWLLSRQFATMIDDQRGFPFHCVGKIAVSGAIRCADLPDGGTDPGASAFGRRSTVAFGDRTATKSVVAVEDTLREARQVRPTPPGRA